MEKKGGNLSDGWMERKFKIGVYLVGRWEGDKRRLLVLWTGKKRSVPVCGLWGHMKHEPTQTSPFSMQFVKFMML